KMFKQYDAGRDGFIDLMELKLMMEKLGAPQTHLGLKNMIKEVDEDFDSKLSFREFLLIFRKAAAGELQEDSGLCVLARLSEIDVSSEGVKGAKSFFEAKWNWVCRWAPQTGSRGSGWQQLEQPPSSALALQQPQSIRPGHQCVQPLRGGDQGRAGGEEEAGGGDEAAESGLQGAAVHL
ncbi:EFHD2 isoform 2, partial [Pongo abelii]